MLKDLYQKPTVDIARELLGMQLCRRTREGLTAGTIVETEAYLCHDDSACHATVGVNRKNRPMFGPPGRAYVYVIHARHCFNVVTNEAGVGEAVLIRAIEPTRGVPLMQARRKTERISDLARGPARLSEAMQIDRTLNDWDLSKGRRLWIESPDDRELPRSENILSTSRIGVTSETEKRLRFILPDNPFVSGPHRVNRKLEQ